jgi:hypothetical protein
MLTRRNHLQHPGLLLAVAGLLSALSIGHGQVTLDHKADRSVAKTNCPISVVASFTNQNPVALRGFYFTEQMPAGLDVDSYSATLNGQPLTNILFSAGLVDDVYPACAPYRWVLEEPASFSPSNAFPAGAALTITYRVTASKAGTFDLREDNWAAYDSGSSNGVFGFSASNASLTLSFVEAAPTSQLIIVHGPNGNSLSLNSTAGSSHAIEESTNLTSWATLTNGIAPFTFLPASGTGEPGRFYRARWLP